MTSVPQTNAEEIAAASPAATSGSEHWLKAVWTKLEQLGDRCNPILVKETRQALKSRQFVITFLIVLIACWIASFAVVSIVGPDIYYTAAGSQMLTVYAVILAFPLMLIVPYSAFRSLASEQEDNTYDLLSITTLTTGQIITGKLASAVVQMLVFLSAVSPCVAFTFLLRGVDTLTVVVLLGYLVLASLGLSMIALLAGTVTKARYSQVFISVLLVLVLALCFFGAMGLITAFISESYQFLREREFFIVNMALLTLYVTTFGLLHAAASAQIAFNSENRSTPLRRIMLLQHVCFLGWMSLILVEDSWDALNAVVIVSGTISIIYWYVMGMMLTSEWPHLSRRVQRSLPQSGLGRTFLTWFNPGPGTGFMFCLANATMVVVAGWLVMTLSPQVSRWGPNDEQVFYTLTLGWSYLVLFLGVGRLLINLARRFVFVSLTAGFLIHFILLLIACGGPLILSFMFRSLQFGNDYSILHMTNPLWTIIELWDDGAAAIQAPTVLTVIGSAAVIALLLNLRSVAVEIQHHRRSLPERVAEDEAELHPEPEPLPANPWEAEG